MLRCKRQAGLLPPPLDERDGRPLGFGAWGLDLPPMVPFRFRLFDLTLFEHTDFVPVSY